MNQIKRPTVHEMREAQLAKAKEHGFESRVLLGGFQSKFWSLLEEDMQARLKNAYANLKNTRPGPDTDYDLCYWQAEIHVYEQLLGLKALTLEEEKKSPQPK